MPGHAEGRRRGRGGEAHGARCRLQQRQGAVDADQHANQVDVHHRQDVLEGLVGEGPAAADAGVVVEDVHGAAGGPAERLERRAEVLAVGNVQAADQAVARPQFVAQSCQTGVVDVEAADEPALGGEQARRLAAHARCSAGDEDALADVRAHGVPLTVVPRWRVGASGFRRVQQLAVMGAGEQALQRADRPPPGPGRRAPATSACLPAGDPAPSASGWSCFTPCSPPDYLPACLISRAALSRSGALGERIAAPAAIPSLSAAAAPSCDMILLSTAWPARSNDSRCSTTY